MQGIHEGCDIIEGLVGLERDHYIGSSGWHLPGPQ